MAEIKFTVLDYINDYLPKSVGQYRFTFLEEEKATRRKCFSFLCLQIALSPFVAALLVGRNAFFTLKHTYKFAVLTCTLPFKFSKNKQPWQTSTMKVVDYTTATIFAPLAPVLLNLRLAGGIISPKVYNKTKLSLAQDQLNTIKKNSLNARVNSEKDAPENVGNKIFIRALYDYCDRWSLTSADSISTYGRSPGAVKVYYQLKKYGNDKIKAKYELKQAFKKFYDENNFEKENIKAFIRENFKTNRQRAVLDIFLNKAHNSKSNSNLAHLFINRIRSNYDPVDIEFVGFETQELSYFLVNLMKEIKSEM